jgi:hypothetical protein
MLTFEKRREETGKLKGSDSSHHWSYTDLIPNETIIEDAGFEVLTVVTMKSTSFWNVIPCSTFEIQTFREMSCFLRHGQTVSQARN